MGFALGEGRSLDEIVGTMHMVAEGVKSAGPLVELARGYGVEMPIAEQVQAIVEGRCSPAEALDQLDASARRGPSGTRRSCGDSPRDQPLSAADRTSRAAPTTRTADQAALAHLWEVLVMRGASDEEIDRAHRRRGHRPLRRRPHARSRPSAATRAVEVAELHRHGPRHARALLAGARVPRRRRRRAGLHRSRPRGGAPVPGSPGAGCGRHGHRSADGPRHRLVHGAHRRGGAGTPRSWVSRSTPSCPPRASCPIADETIPAMAKLLEFVWRRQVAAAIQRSMALRSHGSGAWGEPGPRRGLRRHGRLHAPEPAPERRGAGRCGDSLRGDLPRHRDQLCGAGWSR